MDCIVHGVAKSQTRLSNFHFISLHFGEVSLLGFSIGEKECQDNGDGEQTRPRVGGLCVSLAAESSKLSRCLKILLDKVMTGRDGRIKVEATTESGLHVSEHGNP